MNIFLASHLIFVFVFALLPLDGVSAQTGHSLRGRRTIGLDAVGRWSVCCGLGLLRCDGCWFEPFSHLCVLLTDCRQGVKKPLGVQGNPLAAVPRCLLRVFMTSLFGRFRSGLFCGRLVGEMGYPGLLARQGVSVFLWQGGFRTVCRGWIGGVSQRTDLGLWDNQEVLLWLKQPPATVMRQRWWRWQFWWF